MSKKPPQKPARRGNGEGSIRQRSDGRWEALLTLPDGKRKSLYATTRAAVNHKLVEAQRAIHQGLPPMLHARMRTVDYLDDWLARVGPTIRPSTHRRYRELLAHAVRTIGRIQLAKLTAAHLDRLYAHLQAPLDDGGAGLSSSTAHRVHNVLHAALKDAVRENLLARNVADVAHAPRDRDYEPQLWSVSQARAFLVAARTERLGNLYLVAALTGMRLGELLGLRWRDVDMDARTLHVRMVLGRDGELAEPKTRSGRRQIELPELAVTALRTQRTQQAAERLRIGPAWPADSDLVFTSTVGTPLDGINTLRTFRRFLKRAQLPAIRLHDLRHLQASLLLAAGVHPKVVAERLGHSRVNVTLNTYSHLLPTLQREAADVLDTLLSDETDRNKGKS